MVFLWFVLRVLIVFPVVPLSTPSKKKPHGTIVWDRPQEARRAAKLTWWFPPGERVVYIYICT